MEMGEHVMDRGEPKEDIKSDAALRIVRRLG